MRSIRAIVLLSLLASAPALSEGTVDEQTVWELEETAWEYVKNNDTDGYRQLWADEFVGWPGFSVAPLGKSKIADWIAPLHENPSEILDYELSQAAVRSFGDVVVVHYLYRIYFRSPETGEVLKREPSGRITHTWQRREGRWQIITGMSAGWIGNENDD
jgi:ketosteroid isomerase-like protein